MRHMGQNEAARDGAVVFVAVELSKASWLLAAQASPSGKTSSHKLDGGDVAGLLALLRRLQARERRADGEEVRVVLGHEAGYDGFWLQRRLSAEGIACWVMDPGSLQVDRRARRAKTDRLDAAMLLRALMAWCRGDRSACRMVQVPSAEREDARRTHRERQRLIAERVQHVNRTTRGCSRRRASTTTSRCGATAGGGWPNSARAMAVSCPRACAGRSSASSSGWNSCSSRSRRSRPSATRR
jgi:transposase